MTPLEGLEERLWAWGTGNLLSQAVAPVDRAAPASPQGGRGGQEATKAALPHGHCPCSDVPPLAMLLTARGSCCSETPHLSDPVAALLPPDPACTQGLRT